MAASYCLRLVSVAQTTFHHELTQFLSFWNMTWLQCFSKVLNVECDSNALMLKESSPCRMSCPDMRIDVFVTWKDDLFWQYIKRVSWLAGQGTSYSQNAGDINTGKAPCSDSHWIAIWWRAQKCVSQTVLHGKDITMHWTSSPLPPSSSSLSSSCQHTWMEQCCM